MLKKNVEEKVKEQDQLMAKLETLYINTTGELDNWKTRALEWKEKVNQNTQEQN